MISDDRRSVDTRLAFLQGGAVAVLVTLAIGFWFLQIAQGSRFRELADNNHQRTLTLRAARGLLFDRDGQILVENRYSFDISLVREQTGDLTRSIELLSAISGVDEPSLWQTIEEHNDEPEYRPIVMIREATTEQVAAVLARRIELPGIVVEEVPTRHYRTGTLAAHLFGYVGEITETQISEVQFRGTPSGAIVGQTGIEQAYNRELMGTDGTRRVVVNSIGRELNTIEEVNPVEGRRLQLTIDYDLQVATEEAFRAHGFNGAAVILEPNTGEILAMASVPSYDPNDFSLGIDQATWQRLNDDPQKPLHNRTLQGRYAPGSIFKLVVAVAALEEGIVESDFSVQCNGAKRFYDRSYHCHLRGGHGRLMMEAALERSCNVYFYTLGSMLDIDVLNTWARRLGLGDLTGIDLPHELEGIVPSRQWKMKTTGEDWYPGETISVSIGQGAVSVTPLSQAVLIATIANGGVRPTPYVIKAIDDGEGWKPTQPRPSVVVELQPETIETLHRGLWRVVNARGTGGRARIDGFNVAGKTGTAQVVSLAGREQLEETSDLDFRDHGWFTFFAPSEGQPEIAGVVLAEHSEHGYLAAPIARHVMQTYLAKKAGQPLPDVPQPSPVSTGTTTETVQPAPSDHLTVPVQTQGEIN
jgi:penicillin-binding protein 2